MVAPAEVAELTTDRTKKKYRKDPEAPKGLGLKQLLDKRFKMLDGIPDDVTRAFGQLTEHILMMISGPSGHGKSRLTMGLIKILMHHMNTAYVSPEEGHRHTMQQSAKENLNVEEHGGKIVFYDHTMTIAELHKYTKKKKSAGLIVIDSLQYMKMKRKAEWDALKEANPRKSFIIVSHGKGHNSGPIGKLAQDIEFDIDIKVRVEGGVAFVRARGNGLKHYIIYEEGAVKYWGRKKVNWFKKN